MAALLGESCLYSSARPGTPRRTWWVMKRVAGESLNPLAKATRSPLFQAFSWAMRTLMMLSSWRVAVWSGFGSCAGRRAGATRVRLKAARRREERSVIGDLGGELV